MKPADLPRLALLTTTALALGAGCVVSGDAAREDVGAGSGALLAVPDPGCDCDPQDPSSHCISPTCTGPSKVPGDGGPDECGAAPTAQVSVVRGGGLHSVVLLSSGEMWAFGGEAGRAFTTPVQISLTHVDDVASGDHHTLALRRDGTVYAFGDNRYGQLGNDHVGHQTPLLVQGLPPVLRIAAGALHALALDQQGNVWAWGDNSKGQVGPLRCPVPLVNGGCSTPTKVLTGAVAIAAGDGHSVALRSDHTVWTWGDDSRGQLGRGASFPATPAQVQAPGGAHTECWAQIEEIAAGGSFTLARASGACRPSGAGEPGRVWAWGDNGKLQLGQLGAAPAVVPAPVWVADCVTGIAAGGAHTLLLDTRRRTWAFGDGAQGQLGGSTWGTDGTQVPALGAGSSAAISAGRDHALALGCAGEVWAWGDNSCGELGTGTTNDSASPRRVEPTWSAPGLTAPTPATD